MKKYWGLVFIAVIILATACEKKGIENNVLSPIKDVKIVIDKEGIPHIYADNLHDLLFGQGYIEAKMRLIQMDLLRKRIEGKQAEIFGEKKLGEDIFMRSLNFKNSIKETVNTFKHQRPEVWKNFQGYIEGINAYIEELKEGRKKIPFLAKKLNYIPEKWSMEDVLTLDRGIAFSLSGGLSHKLLFTIVKLMVGEPTFTDIIRFAPAEKVAILPDFMSRTFGITPSYFSFKFYTDSEEVYDFYFYSNLKRILNNLNYEKRKELEEGLKRIISLFSFAGSNNWVISGKKTISDCAILANDMHEGKGNPPTFMLEHLKCDKCGYNAVGMTFAGLPLIHIGTNANVSWGATLNYDDDTDIYLESIDEFEGTVVKEGKRVKIKKRKEYFKVKNSDNSFYTTVETMFDVPWHGPVLKIDNLLPVKLPLHISVRWTGYDNWTQYDTSYNIAQATDVEEAMKASRNHIAGALNLVFADTDGNIGYTGYAKVPIRKLNRRFPFLYLMPSIDSTEWSGNFVPFEYLPHAYNPERGYVVTANNDPIGVTFDNDPLNDPVYIGFLYDAGFRQYRITDLIESILNVRKISVDDNMKIQGDTFSRLAERLVPYIIDAYESHPEYFSSMATEAITYLKNWNFFQPSTDVAPTIFASFFGIFIYKVFHDDTNYFSIDDLRWTDAMFLAKSLLYFLDATRNDIYEIENGMKPFPSTSGKNYFDDSTTPYLETRDFIIASALNDAVKQLKSYFGDRPMDQWFWGDIHRFTINSPFEGEIPELKVKDYPYDGGLYTVDVASSPLLRNGKLRLPFWVSNSPSERMIVEMCKGDVRIYMAFPGGNDENPDGEFYNNLLDDYVSNRYFRISFSDDEVLENQSKKIVIHGKNDSY